MELTEHRTRPIMLTAAAASLAFIPIAREIFWGPMAYAMMGGIIVGTMLTLLFLPALYVAWFRIKEPESAPDHHREKPNSPGIMSTLLSMHFHRGRRNTSPPKLEVLLRCRPVWSA